MRRFATAFGVLAAAATLLVAPSFANSIPRTGERINIHPATPSPATFPAETPFWIAHGFSAGQTDPRADKRALLDPETRFTLEVDGEPVPLATDLEMSDGQPVGKTNVANFRSGLPPGVHRFVGRWYSRGDLVLFSDRAVRFVSADEFTVLDTLGSIPASTQFSVFGAGGPSISGNQLVGPRFTLDAPTVITEFGAFANNCKAIFMGVPDCPGTEPFVVQIRPELNGAPDPSTVLASFPLTHDDDPLRTSFETATPELALPAGTFFATIAAQGQDEGYLLSSASDPFAYTAGLTNVGFVYPSAGIATAGDYSAAVRIRGRLGD